MNTAFMLGWTVGLIEGEGTLHGSPRKGIDQSQCAALVLSITQKDRWILDQLANLHGGKVTTQGLKAFQWYLGVKESEHMANWSMPFLSPHRQSQFKIALDNYHK